MRKYLLVNSNLIILQFFIGAFIFLSLELTAQQKTEITLSIYENPISSTVEAITNSTTLIQAVIYKFDEKSLLTAIKDALDRGVKVQLLVDAEQAGLKKSLVKKTEKHGAKIRLWEDGKLHAKFTIVDNELILTGSFNWTKSAERKNVELVAVLTNKITVDLFGGLFNDLWERAGKQNSK